MEFLRKYNAVPCDAAGRPDYSSAATPLSAVLAHADGAVKGWDAGVTTPESEADLFRLGSELLARGLRLSEAEREPVVGAVERIASRIGRLSGMMDSALRRVNGG